ncbi:uncharacterized protein LOC130746501 [Lotus japonicus]|uniref:uncharacterized protein LOC130746501 n=1 Tax=Lotus japonicus TaxID=34305 RepID=UPI00258903FD|nr:uncharacterized protein LOC130746501 [Lotus japonicus]
MCGEAEESLEHALFFCSTVVPVWLRSPFPLDFRDGCPAGFTFESWFMQLASLDDEWVLAVVLTLLYTVWARRNMWVFDDRWLTLEQVLLRANSMRVVPLEPDISVSAAHVNRLGVGNVWQPPSAGVVKINTDASYTALEAVGLGMVVRNSHGEILACVSAKRDRASSVAVAESLALRWAMMLAIDLGFMAVVFETNCVVLHGSWQRKGKDRSYLGLVIADCYNMLSSFRSFQFVLVRRTTNKAADCLAKFAISSFCNVWLEECPAVLEPILSVDVYFAIFD